MTEPMPPTERLSDKVANLLRQAIGAGAWIPGARLPTEQQLTERYQVSRTVVREAVSQLKSAGLLTSRQGSGVFVARRDDRKALAFDPTVLTSLDAVLQILEVRRALEGEVAALAAQRITPAKAQAIDEALKAIDAAVMRGEDGVKQDLNFHRVIAQATDNPQFERLLDFLEQYQHDAIHVTRAHESLHSDLMKQVATEHKAIARGVMTGRPDLARTAAVRHMAKATRRIEQAAPPIRQAMHDLFLQRKARGTDAAGAVYAPSEQPVEHGTRRV